MSGLGYLLVEADISGGFCITLYTGVILSHHRSTSTFYIFAIVKDSILSIFIGICFSKNVEYKYVTKQKNYIF